MKKDLRARRFVFTINNYTKAHLKSLQVLGKKLHKHSYMVFGLEVGDKKCTEHIQGYIELLQSQRYPSFLQNYFNLKNKKGLKLKFHLSVAKGSAKQNFVYTTKDGKFFEYGEFSETQQGTRTDLFQLKELVQDNPNNIKEIIRSENVKSHQALKFVENLQSYYLNHRNYNSPLKVFWIFGGSGTGKTSLVYENFSDVYSVVEYNWMGQDYSQNECLLFDDFRVNDIPFSALLKIIGKFPYSLPVRGLSPIPLNSPYIVITTPKNITDSYGSDFNEDLFQLKRRCMEIEKIGDEEIDLKKIKYVTNNLGLEKKEILESETFSDKEFWDF